MPSVACSVRYSLKCRSANIFVLNEWKSFSRKHFYFGFEKKSDEYIVV